MRPSNRIAPGFGLNANCALAFTVENLEQRRMLSGGPAALARGGVLNVHGTRGSDVITVSLDKQHGLLDVTVDGRLQTFSARKVKKIQVYGDPAKGRSHGRGHSVLHAAASSADDDQITIAANVTTPTYVLAGAGNNTIHGGGGNETLQGGDGNDSIYGGSGNDLLIAGNGNDFIEGGSGQDTEVGGPGSDTLIANSPGDQLQAYGQDDHVEFLPGAGDSFADIPLYAQDGLLNLSGGADITTVDDWTMNGTAFFGTEVLIGGQLTSIAVDVYGNSCDCGGDVFDGGGVTLLDINSVPDAPRQAILDEAAGDPIDTGVQEFPASDGTLLYATTAIDYYGDVRDIVVDEFGNSLTDPVFYYGSAHASATATSSMSTHAGPASQPWSAFALRPDAAGGDPIHAAAHTHFKGVFAT